VNVAFALLIFILDIVASATHEIFIFIPLIENKFVSIEKKF
jgi:hypothetical protein